MLSAGLLHARMSVHRVAQSYLKQGYQRAVDALLAAPSATLGSLPALCVDTSVPCHFTTEATIAFASPAPFYNRQANLYVNEDRIGTQITITVRAADGTPLAARAFDLLLRRTASPPYVALAGARDETFGNATLEGMIGDDGGLPPATANPCSSAAQGTSDDTVVRVAYQNAQTGACIDGSVWP